MDNCTDEDPWWFGEPQSVVFLATTKNAKTDIKQINKAIESLLQAKTELSAVTSNVVEHELKLTKDALHHLSELVETVRVDNTA